MSSVVGSITTMGDDLVTISIEFVSGGGIDRSAELFWVNDTGEEQRYAELRENATHTQETFPNHRWLVRGRRSHEVLLRITAAAGPAVQHHRIDVGAAGAGELREGTDARADRAVAEELPAVGAEGGGDELAEDAESGVGIWVGADGLCRFVRVPRSVGSRQTMWRELDAAGEQVSELVQAEVRVDTRWLWWLSTAFKRFNAMSGEWEYKMMCALSIAGAYQLDFAFPAWIHQVAPQLGPHPLMALSLLMVLVGAAVAAAVPLTESSLILYNTTSRTEIKLADHDGYSREPSPVAGRESSWLFSCHGGFEAVPADLKVLQGRKSHHHAALACMVVAVARLLPRMLPESGGLEDTHGVQ